MRQDGYIEAVKLGLAVAMIVITVIWFYITLGGL